MGDDTAQKTVMPLCSASKPQTHPGPQKHPCPDCNMCQMCAESRCRLCQGQDCMKPKLSLAEQIALYEKLCAEEREGGLKD